MVGITASKTLEALRLATGEPSHATRAPGNATSNSVKLKSELLACSHFSKVGLLPPVLGSMARFAGNARERHRPSLDLRVGNPAVRSQIESSRSQVLANYEGLPLTFEVNERQTDGPVKQGDLLLQSGVFAHRGGGA